MPCKHKPFSLIALFSALLLSSCATTPYSRAHQHCENLADEEFPLISHINILPKAMFSLGNDFSMVEYILEMREHNEFQTFYSECFKKECMYQTGNEDCRETKAQ